MKKQTPVAKVPIELNDGTHMVYYDTESLCRLEETIGASFLDTRGVFGIELTADEARESLDDDEAAREFGYKFAKQVRISRLRDILWAGLLHENPRLTRQDVSGLFTASMKNLTAILVATMQAYTAAILEDADDEDAKNSQGPEQTVESATVEPSSKDSTP